MGIKYSTYLCNFKKGERPCYAARIKNNGTIGQDAFLSRIAELSGETKERVRFTWDLAMSEIARCLKNGNRVELEVLSGGIGVQGTFASANASWDPAKNALVPFVNAKGDLKKALEGLSAENVTEGAVLSIKSVLDTDRKEDGVISALTVYVSGVNLKQTDREDEGVWLEDADGEIVAKAAVTRSDTTTVDCSFPTLPAPGKYRLVIAGRNGAGEEFGVSMAKKNVEVK